jgi:hypothetical protein
VNLQYADFSESDANMSGRTEVKFKNLEGIRRALEKKSTDWLLRETQEPEAYSKQFDEMVSLITYDGANDGRTAAPVISKPQPAPSIVAKPTEAAKTPAVPPQPVVIAPPVQPVAPQLETTVPPGDEIVPATGSTL